MAIRTHLVIATAAALGLAGIAASASAQAVMVKSTDPLDEPYHYCLDIQGAPAEARLDAPMASHACKAGLSEYSDQAFDAAALQRGVLRLAAFDRCLEPGDGTVRLAACDGSAEQTWRVVEGRVSPAVAAEQCLTLADGPGRIVGSPAGVVWHGRDLSLAACAPGLAQRQSWVFEQSNAPIKPAG